MEFKSKEVSLKDGQKCILRSPKAENAKDMIEYMKITSEETYFMIRYPEEVNVTEEKQSEIINQYLESPRNLMIAAFVNGDLAGNASIRCIRNHLKVKHRAEFGISIKEKYWNNGIGSVLISEILKVAKENGFEQVELGVFSDNIKAQNLYRKYGFEVWGVNRNAYKLKDGTYRDEFVMGNML